MQFSVIFPVDLLLPILGDPGGSLSGGRGELFFPLSFTWIFEDDTSTYSNIIQSCSIMVPYILLCIIHPTYVTPVIFLWTFINIPRSG